MADPDQQAIDFALTPASIADVIDYSTRQGLAIYSAAVRPLYEDPADFFNVESSGLQTFLALLHFRGTTSAWDFEIPQDLDDPENNLLDMITNHGRFTLEHLRAFSATFINNQARAAQDNIQMVKCILSSLTLPGFRKINTWHSDWHIGDRPVAYLLIKVIIRESYIDTQATTRILRDHLSSSPAKLEELKGDIDQFNAFVKVTMDQLAARGETTQDLLANLFKGYLSSRDVNFRKYMEKKQEDYDDGVQFTPDGLMNSASNKFKILVQSGKWMAPTDEQSKILALEAKVSKMGKSTSTSGSNASGSTKQTSSNSGGSGKSTTKKGRNNKPIPAWQTKWPGRDFVENNKPKIHDGRTYYWCKKHKRFCMHKTSECRLGSTSSASQGGNPGTSNAPGSNSSYNANNQGSSPTIRVSTATLMDE